MTWLLPLSHISLPLSLFFFNFLSSLLPIAVRACDYRELKWNQEGMKMRRKLITTNNFPISSSFHCCSYRILIFANIEVLKNLKRITEDMEAAARQKKKRWNRKRKGWKIIIWLRVLSWLKSWYKSSPIFILEVLFN